MDGQSLLVVAQSFPVFTQQQVNTTHIGQGVALATLIVRGAVNLQRLLILPLGLAVVAQFVIDQAQIVVRLAFQFVLLELMSLRDSLLKMVNRFAVFSPIPVDES